VIEKGRRRSYRREEEELLKGEGRVTEGRRGVTEEEYGVSERRRRS
jgi:hypothetical protein